MCAADGAVHVRHPLGPATTNGKLKRSAPVRFLTLVEIPKAELTFGKHSVRPSPSLPCTASGLVRPGRTDRPHLHRKRFRNWQKCMQMCEESVRKINRLAGYSEQTSRIRPRRLTIAQEHTGFANCNARASASGQHRNKHIRRDKCLPNR